MSDKIEIKLKHEILAELLKKNGFTSNDDITVIVSPVMCIKYRENNTIEVLTIVPIFRNTIAKIRVIDYFMNLIIESSVNSDPFQSLTFGDLEELTSYFEQ